MFFRIAHKMSAPERTLYRWRKCAENSLLVLHRKANNSFIAQRQPVTISLDPGVNSLTIVVLADIGRCRDNRALLIGMICPDPQPPLPTTPKAATRTPTTPRVMFIG